MEGGIGFGLSAALYGRITLKDGVVEQSNFHEYPVLRINEMPVVEVHIVPSTEKPTGVGEPGVPPIAPAVANAIAAATGQRIRTLPFKLGLTGAPPVHTPDGSRRGTRCPRRCRRAAIAFAFRDGKVLVSRRPARRAAAALPRWGELDRARPRRRRALPRRARRRRVHRRRPGRRRAEPPGVALRRPAFAVLRASGPLLALAARAFQIVEWDATHRYCGRCGTPTRNKPDERAKECPACGLVAYPRVTPAMMVLVTRGHEMLLARAHRFPPGMFSALAGFVEPGETIEDCIRREVREEVGVEVERPEYFASQPWAFPHSLMIAFTAEYAGGELRPDDTRSPKRAGSRRCGSQAATERLDRATADRRDGRAAREKRAGVLLEYTGPTFSRAYPCSVSCFSSAARGRRSPCAGLRAGRPRPFRGGAQASTRKDCGGGGARRGQAVLHRAGEARHALAQRPREPQARFLKGVAQTEQGQDTAAIATFQSLVEDYPELPEPYNNLAVLYAQKGEYESARVALENAVKTAPDWGIAHENLGDVYIRLGAAQVRDRFEARQGQTRPPRASSPSPASLLAPAPQERS